MNFYTNLAKSAVENYIKERKIISPPKDLPEEFFKRKAGAFVTIVSNGNLRGCIGTYLPIKENIAEEIISNAIAAATEDCRFPSIEKEELPSLSYTVYILSEPEFIKDLKKLNPKKYGIIIRTVPISPSGEVVSDDNFIPKSSLLLPDLEGIDTIEKQIAITCQKGEIDPNIDKILIYRFTVEKYK